MRRRRRRRRLAAGRPVPQAVLPPFNYEIKTLSNRADLISDGDALVQVTAPKTVPMDKVKLLLNGRGRYGCIRCRFRAREPSAAC
jgi:hypothetical protein